MKRRSAIPVLIASVALLSTLWAPGETADARIALGAYIPGADRSPGKIGAYGRKVRRPPRLVMSYKTWDNPLFEPRELNGIWRRGAVPMITWEPWGHSLRRIAGGRYDRYVRASARAAVRWKRPVFLRFAHEMNGDWYPWGTPTSARTYKRAWRHLVKVFRSEGARNVLWAWVPYVNPHWSLPFAGRFPGDRWVDWVGLDGINWGGSVWRSFGQLFHSSYRTLLKISSRPVVLAEVGCGEAGGDKARWVSDALRRQVPRMRRLRAFLWWSAKDPRGDLRVNSSRAALRAFRRATRKRFYRLGRRLLLRTPRRQQIAVPSGMPAGER